MKKVLFVLISILSFYTSAEGCKCQKHDNSFMYLLESNHVFLATVMSVSECGDNNKHTHELWIEDNFKGKLSMQKNIYTDCVTSCSFQLKEGERYLIFSDLTNDNIGFCDLIIPFTDTAFLLTKRYLDEIAYARLDYLELYETEDSSGYRAKLMVYNGQVRGVVNLFNPTGDLVLKGLIHNGQMQGYCEVKKYDSNKVETWTGNYKDGQRVGEWLYKMIAIKNNSKSNNQFIAYQYQNGEIITGSDLSVEKQLENPKTKEEVKQNE